MSWKEENTFRMKRLAQIRFQPIECLNVRKDQVQLLTGPTDFGIFDHQLNEVRKVKFSIIDNRQNVWILVDHFNKGFFLCDLKQRRIQV